MIVEKTGLIEALEAQNTEEARGRIENIREFLGVVRDYVDEHELVPDRGVRDAGDGNEVELTYHEPTLGDFMEWLSLRTDLDSLENDQMDSVTFMTVHSAKGLEFDNVFVAGMEESIFPHTASMLENGVEEERRLAYVAITRARKRLFLTCAARRADLQRHAGQCPQPFYLRDARGAPRLRRRRVARLLGNGMGKTWRSPGHFRKRPGRGDVWRTCLW